MKADYSRELLMLDGTRDHGAETEQKILDF